VTYYVPGLGEKDSDKTIRSLMQAHEKTETNTTDIATNTANIATNTADIATNTADIATNTANIATNTADINALEAGPLTSGNVATQANQETATSTNLAVTPGRQQYHPSAAKAWVNFAGASGTIGASYNVASVSRGSAGVYTVNFTTAFSSTSYAIVAGSNLVTTMTVASASAASINTFNGSFAATDAGTVFAAFYGDQ
jgi:hypothetical protein